MCTNFDSSIKGDVVGFVGKLLIWDNLFVAFYELVFYCSRIQWVIWEFVKNESWAF